MQVDFMDLRNTDPETGMTATPGDPAFIAAVIEATRALLEQVGTWAREGPRSTDLGAILDPTSNSLPSIAAPLPQSETP